jgi:4a-hydroxytetrahydrobiopterin dehydratase
VKQPLLSDDEVRKALDDLDGWEVVDGKLHKEFEFGDFSEAFGFMARVALAAEKLDHHPDWSNSWNQVVVDIVNHAAGGLTQLCVDLATRVDAVAGP